MGQVRGRVPTDNPPYHSGGWLLELPPPGELKTAGSYTFAFVCDRTIDALEALVEAR